MQGLNAAGWPVTPPRATMFVWAKIPEFYRDMGSLEFSKKLLAEAKVAVSPGIGFGEYGEGYVRFRPDRERAPHAPGHSQYQAHDKERRLRLRAGC